MKVGTDGVLLGAWCDVAGKKNVLDVGTGTGLIALMVAQRSQPATIDAIEIDEAAYYEACYNIENSPWSERISVVHIDFSDWCDKEKKYDLIVSNPPYFTNGILPTDGKRKIARHCETLTFDKLITHSITLLSENGIICLITPADAENEITSIVVRNGLNIEKKTVVYPKTGSVPKRILWQIGRSQCYCIVDELFIEHETHHEYTSQYVELTKDFYLNM